MVHLFTADKIASALEINDISQFFLGSVSPDAVNLNGCASQEVRYAAHIRAIDPEVWNNNVSEFYRKNLSAYINEIDFFKLSQPMEITSSDVNKIKEISIDIQSLLDQGIDISVNQASYFYSKLPELKVKLLGAATTDAKDRASAMLKATHNKVGKIQSVKMGVFQITDVDSTSVSDMGINDTSTIDKKVTAVANVVFKIK